MGKLVYIWGIFTPQFGPKALHFLLSRSALSIFLKFWRLLPLQDFRAKNVSGNNNASF